MLVQRSMRGRDQPRVVAQSQVVVGACSRQLRQQRVGQAAKPRQRMSLHSLMLKMRASSCSHEERCTQLRLARQAGCALSLADEKH